MKIPNLYDRTSNGKIGYLVTNKVGESVVFETTTAWENYVKEWRIKRSAELMANWSEFMEAMAVAIPKILEGFINEPGCSEVIVFIDEEPKLKVFLEAVGMPIDLDALVDYDELRPCCAFSGSAESIEKELRTEAYAYITRLIEELNGLPSATPLHTSVKIIGNSAWDLGIIGVGGGHCN